MVMLGISIRWCVTTSGAAGAMYAMIAYCSHIRSVTVMTHQPEARAVARAASTVLAALLSRASV